MAHNQAVTPDQFIQHVDDQLDKWRSEVQRYEPGASWLDEIVNHIDASHISDAEVRRLYVSKVVRDREKVSTRSVTMLAKRIATTGQMPLDWFEFADRPIAYTFEEADAEGNPKNRELRVTLRSATGNDFLAWARWREKQAKKNYDTEMKMVDVFFGWAHEMETGGFRHFDEYAKHVTGAVDSTPEVANA